MLKLEAGAFCNEIGLRVLTQREVDTTAADYRKQLLAGQRGEPSSLPMYPSLLHPVNLGSLKEGSNALVAEIGGTNLYGALVEVQNGMPVVARGYQATVGEKIFPDAESFYQLVAGEVQHLIHGSRVDAIGIVYSFPGTAGQSATGVDMMSTEKLSKGFEIPGISHAPIGESFRRALGKLQGKPYNGIPTVVLNDTVAVLFSIGAKIGGVVGTGFNIATATKEGIVNTESSLFEIRYSHELAERGRPNQYLVKNQIAGFSLAMQMAEAARMVAERLGLVIDTKSVTAATISEVLEGRRMGSEVEVLGEVARRLRDRSAQIVGIMMGTIASTFPEVFHESEVVVPVEGSVFWGIPDYHSIVARVANETSGGKRFEFVNVENAGRIGAAVAALSMVR